MDTNEKILKRRLIAKRKNVKSKLKLLQQGEWSQERMLTPITKHLKNIEEKIKNSEVPPQEVETLMTRPPVKQSLKKQTTAVIPINTNNEEVFISESDNDDDYEAASTTSSPTVNDVIGERAFEEYLEQYRPLPRKYIRDLITDTTDAFDHTYGIKHDPTTESLSIGNSRVDIDEADLVIQNKKYKGTEGLYELLFKRQPRRYTKDDLKVYKEILIKTNAHKRYYQANQQVVGSRLLKYKTIIAPLVLGEQHDRSQSTGSGLLLSKEVNKNSIDHIYWDDPNELVDRLRLLIASQQAGNSSHRNEIVSIIEELQEANIIE